MPLLRSAWLVVVLLFPVALLNYLDRQMIASMQQSVRADVMADIPAAEQGAAWGAMLGLFKWVYAVASPLGGYVADLVSRRLMVCLSLFVWSAITWLTGQVSTYDELLWTRALMGVSEAFYMPAALALIADHHPGATKSRAVGVHQVGIYFGIIAGGFGGFVADHPALGWRSAFDVTGAAGVLYAIPLLLFLPNAPVGGVESSRPAAAPPAGLEDSTPPTGKPAPWSAARELATNPSFLLLVLYFTLPAVAGWVVRDWMPAILRDRFGIDQGRAGLSAAYFAGASIAGAAAGGYFADRAYRRSARGRIWVSAAGMGLIVPAIAGVGAADTLGLAAAALVLFGFGWGVFDCNNMPILSQIVRPGLRATGYGVMNFVSTSAGGFADLGFGKLRDRGVPNETVFGAFAGVALLSVVLVLLIRPGDDKVTR